MSGQEGATTPMRAMHSIRGALDKFLAVICVILFAALVCTVTWQVFSRQVLDSPSEWSEALAKYVFVWLGMFGAALVFSERGHIAVDLVLRKFPDTTYRAAAVLIQCMIIAFAALTLIWGGTLMAQLAWEQNLTVLPGRLGPLYLVLPITGVIIVFYALYHVLAVLRGEETALDGQSETTEGQ